MSIQNFMDCFKASRSFWHSLAVISEVNIQPIKESRNLSLEQIKNICSNVKMFFIGAYDGEGYVFWEKEGFSLIG